jgi:hypothetical protein
MITHTRREAIELLPARSATVAIITTAGNVRGCRVLDDDELLALLSGRPAAIVRELADASRAELVFLDREDARALGVQ